MYIFDMGQQREGYFLLSARFFTHILTTSTLIVFWVTLTAIVVSVWIAALPLLRYFYFVCFQIDLGTYLCVSFASVSFLSSLCLLTNIMAFLFLLGVWGTLQFRWIQSESADFTLVSAVSHVV